MPGGPPKFGKLGEHAGEREVLRWVAYGKSNAEIAEITGLAFATVKNHVHNALQRHGATNRVTLVLSAAAHGELDINEVLARFKK